MAGETESAAEIGSMGDPPESDSVAQKYARLRLEVPPPDGVGCSRAPFANGMPENHPRRLVRALSLFL